MAIPLAHYDTVLLREHLYQDLKYRYLVIPPEAEKPGFKPIHEIGLGLYNYYLIEEGVNQSNGFNIFGYLIKFILGILSLIVISYIYKSIRGKKRDEVRVSGLSIVNDVTYTDYSNLEKGQYSITHSRSSSSSTATSAFSTPPSLINSPSTPSSIISSASTSTKSISTPFSSSLLSSQPILFDSSFGSNKENFNHGLNIIDENNNKFDNHNLMNDLIHGLKIN
ncbi:hypothetical protein CANARDRAFT_175089 [[Candida] arabinofermentans NRRL YB-2248]|uniref:Uncharacterized protein n=1 Tax=[Candida] arabinofermentans NRRL YB-2248 TaxID=983967 RepID=A0A1E4T3A9_9ASCO|nr:hypothetical protein CANARDRAFT_175089 [[Candida] arabinofermentans NRRL YB-2248]